MIRESSLTLVKRPVLIISVEAGPQKGKQGRFDQAQITLGRNIKNDFALGDRFISGFHGKFQRNHEGFVYLDLGSRHGTRVGASADTIPARHVASHTPVPLTTPSVMKIGTCLLRIRIEQTSINPFRGPQIKLVKKSSEQLMTAQDPMQAFSRQFSGKDPRLELLFRMAPEMNRAHTLDQALEWVVEAAFKAFENANLFAVSLWRDGAPHPILARLRETGTDEVREVILSRTMQERAAQTGEAILFVRSDAKIQPSMSMVEADIFACMCVPLSGQDGLLGVMQLDSRQRAARFTQEDLDLFCILASHASHAMERAKLTENIERMFDGFVQASVCAIEARDPTTAGHSERVADYSLALARKASSLEVAPFLSIHFTEQEMRELRYAALLHDFGKVGVREAVLGKASRVSEERLQRIRGRFTLALSLHREQLMGQTLRRAVKSGTVISASDLKKIEEDAQAFQGILNREWAFLEALGTKERLDKADIERVREFGRQPLILQGGRPQPILTPEDIEQFSIPFGTLTESEWADMRSHVAQSEAYLRQIPWSEDLQKVPCIAGAHHEKLDGSGYPKGLTAKDLCTRVRILTIADIFDAATAWDRPYMVPLTPLQVDRLLRDKAAQGQLDADLVKLFLDHTVAELNSPPKPAPSPK